MKSLTEFIQESLKSSHELEVEFNKKFAGKKSWNEYIKYIEKKYSAEDITSDICDDGEYMYLLTINGKEIAIALYPGYDGDLDDISIEDKMHVQDDNDFKSYMKHYTGQK